jgi:bla regulator protein blaR1
MDALSIAVNAIGWTLIHSIWLGALAAAAYAVPAARLRNQAPQAAYAWGLSCLLALVLILLSVFAHEFDRVRASADAQAIATAYAALPVERGDIHDVQPEAAPNSVAAMIEPLLPLLVLAWALAVLTIGSGLVRSQLALRRLVTAGINLPALASPVVELAQYFGVSRPIAVVSSALARAPFVIGHFAPVIVLPLSVATGMPWPQLRLILAHEIAHLRRADYLINWLQIALEVLLFFHPAVRWLSEELRRLREACCDDMVVAFAGGRGDYTRALLSLEEFRHDAPALAPSAVAGGLLWRVQRIAGRAPLDRSAWQRVVLPAAFLTLLAGALSSGLQIRPGYGPRDFQLPSVSMPGIGTMNRETVESQANWEVQLPELRDARLATSEGKVVAPELQLQIAAPQATIERSLTPSTVQLATLSATPARLLPAAAAVPAAVAIEPQPVHTVRPLFPARQRLNHGPLTVELGYGVDAGGHVTDIKVLDAPTRATDFVDAASVALAQWRYPVSSELAAGAQLRHRFVFRDGGDTAAEPAECTMLTGSRMCVVDVRSQRPAELAPGSRCKPTTGSRLCRR